MDHRCRVLKTNRKRCTENAHPVVGDNHLVLCARHRTIYYNHVAQSGVRNQIGRCFHFNTGTRSWCHHVSVEDSIYCERHANRQLPDDFEDNVMRRIDRFGQDDARWAFELNINMNDAMHQFFRDDPRRNEALFGNFFVGMDPGVALMRPRLLPPPRAGINDEVPDHLDFAQPPPIERRRLAVLAHDNQNIHTQEVSAQTNENTQRILAIPVDTTQRSRDILFTEWNLIHGYTREDKIRVALDVDRFFHLRHCRTQPPQEPDDLYRKMLRGLVAYIGRVPDPEIRSNLWRRMFEECRDAVDMCIEGHLARLANVLVGFDDAYRSAVSQGELIQNRISAIYAMELPEDEKARLATAFFDEIALPLAEREPWLTALVE